MEQPNRVEGQVQEKGGGDKQGDCGRDRKRRKWK